MKITNIKARSGWQAVDFSELFRYRDLLYFLTLRGLKAKYAQSVLGIGWAIIQPLFLTFVFTIVFGNLAGIKTDGNVPYVLFSLCAMVPWNYFSGTLVDASNAMVANSNMISKVYFPRLVLPLSAVLSKLLDFVIGIIVLAVFCIIYGVVPSINILVLPLLIVLLLMTSIGIGLVLSAMSIQYRDIKHMVPFLVQILLYAAPVVYPATKVPDAYQFAYSLNPMVGVIEGFRSAILNATPMPWDYILTGFVVSSIIFIVGVFYFQKLERSFADVA